MRAAVLTPGTLAANALALGISGPGLHKRARKLGLPTDWRARQRAWIEDIKKRRRHAA